VSQVGLFTKKTLSKALKTETMLKIFSISFIFSRNISFVAVLHYFLLPTQHCFRIADTIATPSPAGTFVYHLEKYKLFLLYAFFWDIPPCLIFRRGGITHNKAYNIPEHGKSLK